MDITAPYTDTAALLADPLVTGLLESVSDGALVIDAHDRRILAMNTRARGLLGYSPSDIMGCQCAKMMNAPACANACPLTAVMEGRTAESRLSLYYRGRDGRHALHADTRMLLVRGADGRPLAGIELFQDLREVEGLRKALHARRALAGIIGRAEGMQALYRLIEQVAPYPLPVLLTGESGVGKERFADAVHQCSSRADKPLVKINCAALTPELAESALFGHCRGAFTGAQTARKGYFEQAGGGTLLLDEVGELPAALQARLLRVLQEGEIQRVGEDVLRKVDVRVLAATNRDLEAEVAAGRFRRDVYFRLSVVKIEVPPLRARLEDLPLLAEHFLDRFSREYSCPRPRLTPEAGDALLQRPWPGNVRELENVLRLACIKALAGGEILPQHLEPASRIDAPEQDEILNLAELERRALDAAMTRTEGNVSQAARLLGIDRTTLWRKLNK